MGNTQSKMADSEQYNEECGNCNCKLTEDVHIFCLSRGDEEQVWCADCVHSFWQDLKSEGWIADNDTWSELGFDDGEENDVDDFDAPNIYPYKKCYSCSERSSTGNYSLDKLWICETCATMSGSDTDESEDDE